LYHNRAGDSLGRGDQWPNRLTVSICVRSHPKLKRKTNTQFHTTSGVGSNELPNLSGRKNGVYGGDIGMVQQILAARTECKRAWSVFSAREGERTAQIRVEVTVPGIVPMFRGTLPFTVLVVSNPNLVL
jgi:hypothetical protein